MIIQDYLVKENIEMRTLEGSKIVLGSKKIICENKVDIIRPQIVRSNTAGIVIADATTDVEHIYAEYSGKTR